MAGFEALSEQLTTSELVQKYEIHLNQISQWKRDFLGHAPEVSSKSGKLEKHDRQHEEETS